MLKKYLLWICTPIIKCLHYDRIMHASVHSMRHCDVQLTPSPDGWWYIVFNSLCEYCASILRTRAKTLKFRLHAVTTPCKHNLLIDRYNAYWLHDALAQRAGMLNYRDKINCCRTYNIDKRFKSKVSSLRLLASLITSVGAERSDRKDNMNGFFWSAEHYEFKLRFFLIFFFFSCFLI